MEELHPLGMFACLESKMAPLLFLWNLKLCFWTGKKKEIITHSCVFSVFCISAVYMFHLSHSYMFLYVPHHRFPAFLSEGSRKNRNCIFSQHQKGSSSHLRVQTKSST